MASSLITCKVVQVPGPQGPRGPTPITPSDGLNAFSFINGGGTLIPPYSGIVTLSLVNPPGSQWMVLDQIVYIQAIGYYEVLSLPSDDTVELVNLGYTNNVNGDGTVTFADHLKVSPGGNQGPAGSLSGAAGGDLQGTYPNPTLIATGTAGTYGDATHVPVVTTDAAGRVANVVATAITFPSTATPTGAAGGDLQGTYPNPTLAVTGVAANTYGSAARNASVAISAEGRVTAASSLQPRLGLLGSVTAAQLQTGATDIPVAINSSRYVITAALLESPSAAVTTATGGLFSGTGGSGTICADQALSALSGTSKFFVLALDAGYTTTLTGAQVQFRVGTGEGSSRTVNVWLFGYSLSP